MKFTFDATNQEPLDYEHVTKIERTADGRFDLIYEEDGTMKEAQLPMGYAVHSAREESV